MPPSPGQRTRRVDIERQRVAGGGGGGGDGGDCNGQRCAGALDVLCGYPAVGLATVSVLVSLYYLMWSTLGGKSLYTGPGMGLLFSGLLLCCISALKRRWIDCLFRRRAGRQRVMVVRNSTRQLQAATMPGSNSRSQLGPAGRSQTGVHQHRVHHLQRTRNCSTPPPSYSSVASPRPAADPRHAWWKPKNSRKSTSQNVDAASLQHPLAASAPAEEDILHPPDYQTAVRNMSLFQLRDDEETGLGAAAAAAAAQPGEEERPLHLPRRHTTTTSIVTMAHSPLQQASLLEADNDDAVHDPSSLRDIILSRGSAATTSQDRTPLI